MMKIQMYRETAEHGHETIDLEPTEVKEAVEKELDNDRWVAVEKKDGSSEVLTKEDTKEPSWKDMFGKPKTTAVKSTTTKAPPREVIHTDEIESITSTMKARGG